MSKYINRSERQVRSLSRGLFLTTTMLVCLSIGMTSKFGWGLGVDIGDKLFYALMAATLDIVGALAMGACGVLFARKYRLAAWLSVVMVLLCAGISAVAIFGYQSSNRVAVAKGREKLSKLDAEQLEWLRNQTTSSGKSEKQTMLGEVKEQMRSMKSADAVLEPDAQASELAVAFGVDEGKIRRWINMGTSGVILCAQFACLWLYGFLRQRVEPEISQQGSTLSGNFPETFPENVRRFSKAEARLDLQRLIDSGASLNHGGWFAFRWGIGEGTASKWLDEFREEGLIRRKQIGQRKVVLPATKSNGVLGSNVTTLRRQT